MRIGQTSAVYFVSKFVGSVLGFLATVYFARLLGSTVVGYYSLTIALVTWLAIAGKAGVEGALIKRVSEGDERESYVTAGVVLVAVLFAVVAVGVLVLGDAVDAFVGAPVAGFVILLVFATLSRAVSFASLQGHHLVHVYALLASAKMGIRSVVQIALVVVGWGLAGMLVGYAVGGLVVAAVGFRLVKFRPTVPEKRHFVDLFDFAKFSWLGNLRNRTFNSIDVVVLGAFVSAGLVGVYAVAWSIGKFLDIFGSAIGKTLFPEMSEIATKDDPRAVRGLAEDALTYAGLLLIPGLVGAAVVGDLLLAIYGQEFVVGRTVLVVLVAALLVYTYAKQLLVTLNAIDRPDLSFRVNGAVVVSNVALNVGLVYAFGWLGAAVATALSAAVGLVLGYRYLRPHVPVRPPVGEVTRQWLAAGVMGAIVFLAREALGPTAVGAHVEPFAVVLVAIGAAVYFACLFAISAEFRRVVVRNLPLDALPTAG